MSCASCRLPPRSREQMLPPPPPLLVLVSLPPVHSSAACPVWASLLAAARARKVLSPSHRSAQSRRPPGPAHPRCSHPAIPHLHDYFFDEDGSIELVMDLMEGGWLGGWVIGWVIGWVGGQPQPQGRVGPSAHTRRAAPVLTTPLRLLALSDSSFDCVRLPAPPAADGELFDHTATAACPP
jgi:hypothetical protein